MTRKYLSIIALLQFVFLSAFSQSISTTPHNLSVSGSGSVISDTESEICVFCHTPHNSLPTAPLWNRSDPGSSYSLYNSVVSSSLQATTGQPDGASILCLSCHDGTIALGNVYSRVSDISFGGGITTMPSGNTNLSTDLTDDHPVSFVYNSALSGSDGQLVDPSSLPFPISLDGNNKLQCTSCHDPHENNYTKFLLASNQYSDLCISCHNRDYWSSSSHESSTVAWNSTMPDPWAHIETPYTTVAENACENCHSTHNANGNERLMKSATEENNCLDCHNGNVASTNIETDLVKTYIHNVYGYNGIHDSEEASLIGTIHIECEDCHNPHAVNSTTASAPAANGFISGVKGVDQSGVAVDQISNEYELCYRCHADNPVTSPPTTRLVVEGNVRLEFDNTSASFHPVANVGKNAGIAGLITPWTATSRMYCTDCHASDGGTVAGPHGSIYPQILVAYYNREDFPDITDSQFSTEYELCAICHDLALLDGPHAAKQYHIAEYLSCNACHDPHGSDQPFLLNYDLVSMEANTAGNTFINTTTQKCNMVCHPVGSGWSKTHTNKNY